MEKELNKRYKLIKKEKVVWKVGAVNVLGKIYYRIQEDGSWRKFIPGGGIMPCRVKDCKSNSVAMFDLVVKGFIPRINQVGLCEKHTTKLPVDILYLKNGGRVLPRKIRE